MLLLFQTDLAIFHTTAWDYKDPDPDPLELTDPYGSGSVRF